MNRRELIKAATLGSLVVGLQPLRAAQQLPQKITPDPDLVTQDYLSRIRHPNRWHKGDVLIQKTQRVLFTNTRQRLGRIYKLIGYRNFNIVSFDGTLKLARQHADVGAFEPAEIALLERLFYADAKRYGFEGEKPVTLLTTRIDRSSVRSIRGSGHFLFRGKPLDTFQHIQREIGDSIILTSGVRGVIKQMYLFTSKADRYNGNLSLASRSIAPPGYSFHGTGDFDIGKRGWGRKNFTSAFAKTEEFKKLSELGYVNLRYPPDNKLGVRFEPWHIKIDPLRSS